MIFLPIKPIYAFAIKNGTKKVEFRKVPFRNKGVNCCIVYASSPYKRIIGYFTFRYIEEDSPDKIWHKYKKVGGIRKQDFDEYYQGTVKAYAIEISSFKGVKDHIDPFKKLTNFTVPQSFKYMSEEEVRKLFSAIPEESDEMNTCDR